ncbi:MAG: tetratricopeptide repeat protein [Limisphaerales bacterium]
MSDAIERWERLLEAQPNHDLARFSLGKAYFDSGRHAEALHHLNLALAKKPDWMVVQILVGKCHQALGDLPLARSAYETALKLAIDQHHEGPQMEMEQILEELGA